MWGVLSSILEIRQGNLGFLGGILVAWSKYGGKTNRCDGIVDGNDFPHLPPGFVRLLMHPGEKEA
jgi:hypothetical protein